MFCYTYEEPRLHKVLIKANNPTTALESEARVELFVDHGQLSRGNTSFMKARIDALSTMARTQVWTVTGFPLCDGYADSGISMQDRTDEGAQHSKAMWSGFFEIMGSTNWTASSMCNHERSALIWHNKRGYLIVLNHRGLLEMHGTPYRGGALSGTR